MTNEQTISDVAKETHKSLTEFLSHARAGGHTLEGDVAEFIQNTAHQIVMMAEAIGKGAVAVEHMLHLDQMIEVGHRMLEQVEDNEVLQSFWEEMIEEIPDLIEWIQSFLEKSGDVIVETAEAAGEVAMEASDVVAEVASTL